MKYHLEKACLLKNDGYGNSYEYYYIKLWDEWIEVSGKIKNGLCINIPKCHLDKIDKYFISKVNNLESLRILRNKIGADEYISILSAKVINEKIDHKGNKMKLYVFNEIGENTILLEVICKYPPRTFNLPPLPFSETQF